MRRYISIGIGFIAIMLICVFYFGDFSGMSVAGSVPLDELPAGFLDTARHELPQVKFDKVWKLKNGNYEIRGKDAKGKVREVELDSNGKLVEVE